jgi:Derlin-2/3
MDFSELTREIKKIPPVTRFLCGGSLALTLPVMLKILQPQSIIYWWPLVKNLEIWRIPTSFLFGSTGLNYIFDLVMLYRNSDALETGPFHRASQNYAWQLFIACAAILIVDTPLRAFSHLRPLLVCITYLTSALAPPNTQTNFFGLITFPVKYMPHVMVFMDFLMLGPLAAAQSLGGAIVGHVWWWGVFGRMGGGRTGLLAPYGVAPSWVKNFVSSGGSGITSGYEAQPAETPSARTTATRQNTAGTYQWGSGQRLGTQ